MDIAKVNVVAIVPYIIMKTAALGRGKAKDAYDIYFILKHYRGGVKALAKEFAPVSERNGKFCVIYNYTDAEGKRRQKWETYHTRADAKKRKKEIEYRQEMGAFTVPKCKTVKDLMDEYVPLYGKEHWALSHYSKNMSLINNYIIPLIGDTKLNDINTRFLEKFYQSMTQMPGHINPISRRGNEHISPSTIRDIHKLLRSAFQQAVKWT